MCVEPDLNLGAFFDLEGMEQEVSDLTAKLSEALESQSCRAEDNHAWVEIRDIVVPEAREDLKSAKRRLKSAIDEAEKALNEAGVTLDAAGIALKKAAEADAR